MPHCSANHLRRWPREPFPRERANSWRIILPANAGDTRGGGLSPERSPFAVLEGKGSSTATDLGRLAGAVVNVKPGEPEPGSAAEPVAAGRSWHGEALPAGGVTRRSQAQPPLSWHPGVGKHG